MAETHKKLDRGSREGAVLLVPLASADCRRRPRRGCDPRRPARRRDRRHLRQPLEPDNIKAPSSHE